MANVEIWQLHRMMIVAILDESLNNDIYRFFLGKSG